MHFSRTRERSSHTRSRFSHFSAQSYSFFRAAPILAQRNFFELLLTLSFSLKRCSLFICSLRKLWIFPVDDFFFGFSCLHYWAVGCVCMFRWTFCVPPRGCKKWTFCKQFGVREYMHFSACFVRTFGRVAGLMGLNCFRFDLLFYDF